MPEYQITETQMDAIRDRLTLTVGSAMAQHIANTHPRTLTADHVVKLSNHCEMFKVTFPFADDRLIVVWTSEGGMDLPEGTEKGQFLCGVYRNEISEEALVVYNGDPAVFSAF